MGRILIITIIIDLIISLTIGIIASFVERAPLYFIYIGMLILGSYFVPILIATALFFLVKRGLKRSYNFRNLIFYSFLLFFVIQLGLLIWSMLDVIRYNLGFSGFTIQRVISDYNREFARYILVTIFISFAIPVVDMLMSKRELSKTIQSENRDY